ncbi:hypothetical protein KUTeg_007220 [Tegillarca granosa]|uniref:Uncharacterized protein n=1 Tax=Tegillarca granosa TaxID=220873 RepID=A0ABQ9FFM5_TEGGR|nr:hypothetical protein KUTeg_007220 [Tegillarca granosa]
MYRKTCAEVPFRTFNSLYPIRNTAVQKFYILEKIKMSEVRQRKSRSNYTKTVQNSKTSTKKSKVGATDCDENETDPQNAVVKWLNILIGIVAMLGCGYIHANYMATIHENWMWFSNIKLKYHIHQSSKVIRGDNLKNKFKMINNFCKAGFVDKPMTFHHNRREMLVGKGADTIYFKYFALTKSPRTEQQSIQDTQFCIVSKRVFCDRKVLLDNLMEYRECLKKTIKQRQIHKLD